MKDFHLMAIKEIKLWAWAAVILPTFALGAIILIHYVGFETWIHIAIVFVTTVLFAIAVVWWWWALHTIASITNILTRTLDKFEKVEEEVVKLKQDVATEINNQNEYSSNRKRSKSKKD